MYSDRCGYLHQNSWPWGKSLLQYLLACKRMIWTTPNHKNHPNTAHSPTSRLWYLSSYHDPLQAHMHPLHKLGNANTIANYHGYYQILIKNGISNEVASSAYLTASYVPVKTKCIIMKYRTGTLYNQRHAVWFKHSISLTCPLCPQLDSALHILSGCHTQTREKTNLAWSLKHQKHRIPRVLLCLHGKKKTTQAVKTTPHIN